MKRIFVISLLGVLSVGFLWSCGTANQAISADKGVKTAYLIDSLIAEANFKFVPTDVDTRTGQRMTIQGYEAAQFLPGRVYVHMTGVNFEGLYEGETPYDRADKKGDTWFVNSTFDYHTGKITFEFVITRSTGKATLKVTNNRASQPIYYIGWIQPN